MSPRLPRYEMTRLYIVGRLISLGHDIFYLEQDIQDILLTGENFSFLLGPVRSPCVDCKFITFAPSVSPAYNAL